MFRWLKSLQQVNLLQLLLRDECDLLSVNMRSNSGVASGMAFDVRAQTLHIRSQYPCDQLNELRNLFSLGFLDRNAGNDLRLMRLLLLAFLNRKK